MTRGDSPEWSGSSCGVREERDAGVSPLVSTRIHHTGCDTLMEAQLVLVQKALL